MANLKPTRLLFSITLVHHPEDGTVDVLNAELSGPEMRRKMVMAQPRPVEEVLCADLAQFVIGVVNGSDGDVTLAAYPDEYLELSGLVLGKLRVFFRAQFDRRRNVIVRFSSVIGDINQAFQERLFFDRSVTQQCEAVSVDMLESICAPIVDILAFNETTPISRANEAALRLHLDRIDQRKDELLLHIERLKTLIRSNPGRLTGAEPDAPPLLETPPLRGIAALSGGNRRSI